MRSSTRAGRSSPSAWTRAGAGRLAHREHPARDTEGDGPEAGRRGESACRPTVRGLCEQWADEWERNKNSEEHPTLLLRDSKAQIDAVQLLRTIAEQARESGSQLRLSRDIVATAQGRPLSRGGVHVDALLVVGAALRSLCYAPYLGSRLGPDVTRLAGKVGGRLTEMAIETGSLGERGWT